MCLATGWSNSWRGNNLLSQSKAFKIVTASNRVWCPVYLQRLCEAHLLPLSLFPCCLPPNHFRTTTSSWQLKLSADQGTKSSSRNHSRKKQVGPTLRSWARDEACTSDDLPWWSHRPSLLVQPTTEHNILFFFFFWPYCVVCSILVPWPGIQTRAPYIGSTVLTIWLSGSPLNTLLLLSHYFLTCFHHEFNNLHVNRGP